SGGRQLTVAHLFELPAVDARVVLRLWRQKLRGKPTENVIHDRLGEADLRVARHPRRLESDVAEFINQSLKRHAVLEGVRNGLANASAKPEMVEPSLAITRKISPGSPFSNRPTVM